MFEFEFTLCEQCNEMLQCLSAAAAMLGDESCTPNVLGDLCADCADRASMALAGGAIWN